MNPDAQPTILVRCPACGIGMSLDVCIQSVSIERLDGHLVVDLGTYTVDHRCV